MDSGDRALQTLFEIVSRSQLGYRELIDNLDHAVFSLGLDGSIRVANRYLADRLGVSFQDLIGRSLDEFVAVPTRAEMEAALPKLLKEGSWGGRVSVHLRQCPGMSYFDCRFQIGASSEGGASINGWARDVTAQQEAEERFGELFESLREGIFFTSVSGELLDANPALVRMLGYESREEMQKFNFREMYADPADREPLVQELTEKGSFQDRRVVLKRKDGKRVQCIASGFVVRDTFGRVSRLQGTVVDVSERLEIERRLRDEQDFVRQLIASFPDIIAVLDRGGRYTYVSTRVTDVLGYTPQNLQGTELGANAHPEDRETLSQFFRDLTGGRESYIQIEFRSQHADGTWRTLRATAGPLFDASGKISGVVASARDVTQAKHVEQQLLQKEKLASMGQMMAGAAHELNNPLTAILGVSDLLRERAASDESRRHAEIILQQARRAASIVQNLLAYSRQGGRGDEPIRMDEIVRRVADSHAAGMKQKNIELAVEIAPGLPSIHGDAKLLSQALSNLLTNAEQAISAGRGQGRVRLAASYAGGKLRIIVTDDGPGIPPEILTKIFDPFFTTKRPGGGSGLGLAICLAVAKEHGGTIEVDSPPGAGAQFSFVVPAASPAASREPAPPPLAHAVSPAADSSRKPAPQSEARGILAGHSVLIVDDEESIREIVSHGLVSRGMEVESAPTGEEAFDLMLERRFEIVVCDFNLPGWSGKKLFEEARSKFGDSAPRFVLMTGDFVDPGACSALQQGGASVLQKPFHVSALVSLLGEIFESAARVS
ncbi:MAG TPA: PAS domain S-box protein [Verrucomicrobiae bacterium]|nr:PAS domain S-box protein [Verrucomicrobiae bacterium]